MILPKTHTAQIKSQYEALLAEDDEFAINHDAKTTDKRSLNQILRNVESLTKAIISYEA
jgi:hypothetical protein